MRQILILIITLQFISNANAQSKAYPFKLNYEAPAPNIITYPDESSALTLQKEKSPFYIDLTSRFAPQSLPVRSESPKSNLKKELSLTSSVSIPASWKDREMFIVFTPQETDFKLFINGTEAALIERGMPMKINVTSFLQEKEENLITLKADVGQNLKFKAINKVSMLASSKVSIIGLYIFQYKNPWPSRETDWSVHLYIKNHAESPYGRDHKFRYTLYDSTQKQVKLYETSFNNNAYQQQPLLKGQIQHAGTRFHGDNFLNKWNSETPNLYHLTIQVSNPNNEVVEVISEKVGLRVVTFRENKFYLGNKPLSTPIHLNPVILDGPLSNDSLYTPHKLRASILSLKRHNVNTIVLSKYPATSSVYDLCDELGMYIIQRIDFPGQEDLGKLSREEQLQEIGKFNTWALSIVHTLKNHPSVLAWHLNADAKQKGNFQPLLDSIWVLDRDRPAIFQKSSTGNLFPLSGSPMPNWHTLGEQQRAQLKKSYQLAGFWVNDPGSNLLYLSNKYDFNKLDYVVVSWELRKDGKTIKGGEIDQISILPQKSQAVRLPFNLLDYRDPEEYTFKFSLKLKGDTYWAEKGHIMAEEEFRFDDKGSLVRFN